MSLLDIFDLVASHPKNIKEIRRLILQLGIQGRLTTQWRKKNFNYEPAIDWHKRIEKGSSKSQKSTHKNTPPPDNVPFDLPNNWSWYKLGDLTYNLGQKIPDGQFSYIDVSSVDNIAGVISKDIKIVEATLAPSRARKIVRKGCVIYSTVRPYLLNIAIVDRDFEREPIASTAFAVLNPIEGLDSKYLFYYLRSQVFIDYVESQMAGVAYPAINDSNLMEGYVAVPPYPEQIQIVKIIESLFEEVDQLENLLYERKALKETFVTTVLKHIISDKIESLLYLNFIDFFDDTNSIRKLREAILQLAVQGRLTAQWRKENPNQEPASELLKRIAAEKARLIKEKKISKEKPLPPITAEEMPYEVPEGWVWCRLREVIELISGQHIETADYNNRQIGVPYLTGPSDFGDKHPVFTKWSSLPKVLAQKNDILITVKGSGVGKLNVLHIDDVAIGRQLMAIRSNTIDRNYIYLFLDSNYLELQSQKIGVAIPGIGREDILYKKFPLPPLPEQHAIVQKANTLLAYCDELEQQVQQSKADLDLLMQAVLGEVFGREHQALGSKATKRLSGKETLMPDDITKPIYEGNALNMELLEILQQQPGGKIAAVNLWKMSKYQKDIDAFYEALKREVEENKTIKEAAEKGWLELVAS